MTSVRQRIARLLPATPGELAAALWSFAYFFALLAGYYVLRPLRDQSAIAGGVKALPWMFTATFVTLLIAQPLYGELVARLPRRRFIPIVYHFFVLDLVLFWLFLTFRIEVVAVARVFFVWVSVFNLFAVTVFWSFMADLFTSEQGKRLFGFIGAGGTAGALLGPLLTIALAVPLGPANLLLVAALLLEAAVYCAHRLERSGAHVERESNPERSGAPAERDSSPEFESGRDRPIGGGAFAALPEVLKSPYLIGVAAWVSLLSFGATILYFAQANLVAAHVRGAAEQTRLFASIDLAVSVLTLLTQLVATGALLKRFGTAVAAALLPAVYVAGFAVLALVPTLVVVLVFQVVQRWANFAIANPARQLFYTVVGRAEKYKAKNLIDVVVYRGSDALYGWVFDSLQVLGLKIAAIAMCALPISAAWLVLSVALGRTQERRAALLPPAFPGD
ncbi:MAG TPA: MFS transporter [Casimicrobiaceae bacterium]